MNEVSVQTVVLSSLAMEPMRFDDLSPIEIPVSIKNTPYILREAGAGAAVAYENARLKAAKMNDGKLSGFDGMFDADLILLSMCLFQVDKGTGQIITDNGVPRSTPVQTIRGWLDRVYKPLLVRLKAISPSLEEKETEETLVKQLENIQQKLDDLRKKKAPAIEEDDGPPRVQEETEVLSAREEQVKNS